MAGKPPQRVLDAIGQLAADAISEGNADAAFWFGKCLAWLLSERKGTKTKTKRPRGRWVRLSNGQRVLLSEERIAELSEGD